MMSARLRQRVRLGSPCGGRWSVAHDTICSFGRYLRCDMGDSGAFAEVPISLKRWAELWIASSNSTMARPITAKMCGQSQRRLEHSSQWPR
jgi:hypothetical protein